MKSGIYQIKNLVNGKVYIGQAGNIARRRKEHRNALRSGKHSNRHLQSAWKKYGDSAFEFSVVEYCAPHELNDRERFWIEKTGAFTSGYNQTSGGDGSRGFHPGPETRRKLSAKSRARWRDPGFRTRVLERIRESGEAERIPVIQVETGVVFASVTLAAQSVGHSSSEISLACSGKMHTCGGCHWRYYTDGVKAIVGSGEYENWKRGIVSRSKSRKVRCIETGLSYQSASEAERETGITASRISKCCLFREKSAGGLHWCYDSVSDPEWRSSFASAFCVPDQRRRGVICVDTGEYFSSVRAAAEACGTSKTAVSNCCRGIVPHAGGFRWKYSDMSDGAYLRMVESAATRAKSGNERKIAALKDPDRRASHGEHLKERYRTDPDFRMTRAKIVEMATQARRKPVVQVETGVEFPSVRAAARSIGLSTNAHISDCLRGTRQTAGGYHWEYAEGDGR